MLERPVKQQYKPLPQMRRRKRRQSSAGSFLRSFLITLILLSSIAAFAYHSDVKASINDLIAALTGSKGTRTEFNLPFSPRRQNILFMGVDVASNAADPFKGNRSDTMLLVSIAPYGKDINVISIPRDSKVYIADRSRPDKINHAFAFGGADLAVKTVEETFGVKVDHYIALSNTGLIKFIDTIGGLPIYIEKDMHYHDNTAGLHIDLTQGQHVLNGEQTEGYLRFRKDALGDIGRIRRQQWFFNALMARLKEPSVLVKIPEVLKVMPKYIQTDLSVYELSQYAAMVKAIDVSSIQVATLPGTPSTKGIISYWILDPDKTQEIINKLVYRDKSAPLSEALNVGILYTPSKEAVARDLKMHLEQNGAIVKMQNRNKLTHDHIAVHNLDVSGDVIESLKKTIPEMQEKQTVYDPVGFNKAAKDFTVVLAGS